MPRVRVKPSDYVLLAVPVIASLAVPGAGVLAGAVIIAVLLVVRRDIRAAVLALWWRAPIASLALGVATGIVGLCLSTLYIFVGRRLLPCSFAHMTIDTIGITDLYTNDAITGFVAHHVALLQG